MRPADARRLLRQIFDAAVAAVHPSVCLPEYLPPRPRGRTLVCGAGKAAAAMAASVEEHWDRALSGLVITRYGHGCPTKRIEVVEAGHPVPDEAGSAATARMLGLLRDLTAEDLVLFLGSGGGSALLTSPVDAISLSEKQAITRALLKSGADIHAINTVRKHLSAIKGGRLARAAQPAAVAGLYISDVVGDDPATIASGPTAPDPTTRAEAREILARYGVDISAAVDAWLHSPESETPKPGDPLFAGVRNRVIATARDALAAAARRAEALGVTPVVLGEFAGEAREVARAHAEILRQYLAREAGPIVLLSGGETTVTVRGCGRGGRNSEYLLALALALNGPPRIWALACDTDGIDGTEANAGALLAPDSLARAAERGVDAAAALARHDSYAVFEALGDLVQTGPTRTNVNDLRAILILPA
jgi:hydroxypyruvate reductase